jgi:hypothetical protein
VVDRVDDRAGDALTVRLAQALGVLIRVVEQVLTALGMDNRTTLLRPRLVFPEGIGGRPTFSMMR